MTSRADQSGEPAVCPSTAAQFAGHTALRRGATRGRVPGVMRLPQVPAGDPWYTPVVGGAR